MNFYSARQKDIQLKLLVPHLLPVTIIVLSMRTAINGNVLKQIAI